MAAAAAMQNFTSWLPTKLVFGKGAIAEINKQNLIPSDARVMLVYGGGSIKHNGIYDQVLAVVKPVCEFSGIEPNPSHETCMRAVELANKNNITFILAVGGGSVLDATKYIVCAMGWDKSMDPYDIILHWGFGYPNEKAYEPHAKIPFGTVLTIPAAGSEANSGAVISHNGLKLKKPFQHASCFPQFSVLDPEVVYSLPPRQATNGIVDAYVHCLEQYLGHYQVGRLQDRQTESILCSLYEIGAAVLADQKNYKNAADFMWCASAALNGNIGLGVPSCWASHMIGHELTAFYGLDHGQTLALTVPAVMKSQKPYRAQKYAQYAQRVFGYSGPDAADKAIELTEKFFQSLGQHTKLSKYGMDGKHFEEISKRFASPLGTEKNIDSAAVLKILQSLL